MKLIIHKLGLLVAMLLTVFTAQAYDYDFKVDDIYYKIVSEKERTVETRSGRQSYTGKVEIPSKVIHENKTYKVVRIGERTFEKCSELTSVIIPNSVTEICKYAFSGCSGLTSVTIPNSVTSISNSAFSDCSELIDIIVDENNAFYCSIDGILYNNDVTELIFCTQKKIAVSIPNSVTKIGGGAFSGCRELTSVTIPNSVTTIGGSAFFLCSGLTSVTIPNSVTEIGDYAFYYCSGLTSVTIPNSVTSILEYTFYRCSGLTSVTIPNSVTEIGGSAFAYCNKLADIHCQADTPPSGQNGIFGNTTLKECKLYIPIGCKVAYESVDPWRNFWNIEEFDFSGINETAVAFGKPLISVENDVILISNVDENPYVEVVDISGKKVYSGYGNMVSGLTKDIYIVKVGVNVVKVQL